MKRHSLMITAAALAAAMVLGTGCAKKPAVETSETVTSQASAAGDHGQGPGDNGAGG